MAFSKWNGHFLVVNPNEFGSSRHRHANVGEKCATARNDNYDQLCSTHRKTSCTPPIAPLFQPPPHHRGEVPEWSNGPVSKAVVPLRAPRVRIPVSPPQNLHRNQVLLFLNNGLAACKHTRPRRVATQFATHFFSFLGGALTSVAAEGSPARLTRGV